MNTQRSQISFKTLIIKIFVILFLFITCIVYTINEISRSDYIDFAFLDVGQGDGSIIEIHNKNKNTTRVMIDTGRNYRTITSIEKFYSRNLFIYIANTFNNNKNIDTLILTHNDNDHVGMRCEIINKYHVKTIIISSSMSTSTLLACDKDNIIKNKLGNEIFLQYVYAGDEINIRNVNIKILNPPNPYITQTFFTSKELSQMRDNNKSIVALVTAYNKKILYVGDIDKLDELRIVNESIRVSGVAAHSLKDLYILKVAHHGSDGSSGDAFIKYVSPEISVVSVGKNNYGHPSPRVLDLLTTASSTIYRTDVEGNITFRVQ